MFLAGLVLVPGLIGYLLYMPQIGISDNPALLMVAGLAVGVGTRMGNGCTRGHGVCGMTRFSRRSFVSVATFMAIAALVASSITPMVGG